MTARFICGFETGDDSFWNSTNTSGLWSTSIAATYARTGGFGLQVIRASGTTAGNNGYLEALFGLNASIWDAWGTDAASSVNNDEDLATNETLASNSETNKFPVTISFYFRVEDKPTNGLVNDFVFQMRADDSTRFAGLLMKSNGLLLTARQASTSPIIYNPTAATWYRVEVDIYSDHLDGRVYAETGTTPLGQQSLAYNTGDTYTMTTMWLGVEQLVNVNEAREYWFDDFSINDATNGYDYTSLHTANPGTRGCSGTTTPNGAGAHTEWNSTGTNWEEVDDWIDTADYNETVAGASDADSLKRDAYAIDNFVASATGAIPKVVAVLTYHVQPDSAVSTGHKAGILESSEWMGCEINESNGSPRYSGVVAGERGAGNGAWTAATVDAAEFFLRRSAASGIYQFYQRAYSQIAEVADDNGVTFTPPVFVPGRRRASFV